MARGIEHRNIEGVITAYEAAELPCFGLFSGNELMMSWAGDNIADGADKLEQYLQALEQGQSGTTYTLKLYPDKMATEKINNKTPYVASTTFNFKEQQAGYTRQPDGTIIVTSPSQNNNTPARAVGSTYNDARIQELESKLEREREARHRSDLAALEAKFEQRLAGIGATEKEKTTVDKIFGLFEKLIEAPEIVGKWKDALMGPKQNYILNADTPMNGTKANNEEMVTEQNPDNEVHARLIDNFLTPEERTLKSSKQNAIVKERLAKLTEDELEDLQLECLEKIEERIGRPMVTLALTVMQGLDDEDLNKLLSHLM